MAALQAVELVSELVNEACIIARKAKDSGDPWGYVANLKIEKLNLNKAYHQNTTFTISKAGINKYNTLESQLVTSTPQKGQGDEDTDSNNKDIIKSTAIFINHLFNMSDLEGINEELEKPDGLRQHDNIESKFKDKFDAGSKFAQELQKNSSIQPEYLKELIENITVKTTVINKEPEYIQDCNVNTVVEVDKALGNSRTMIEEVEEIINSYINIALCQVVEINTKIEDEGSRDSFEYSTGYSSYSYLSDAFVLDDLDGWAFSSENYGDKAEKPFQDFMNNKIMNEKDEINYNITDICSYENAYITLNRDYEQYSEEEPVLRDTKCISMQEIDLGLEQANETLRRQGSITKSVELPTTSKLSAVKYSRKSTLLRRCRLQGRKFFTCVRWWWRRKLTGRRKISRTFGSVGGLCTLSPDAKRRTTSLLDHIRDEPSTQSKLWKFNTISGSFFRASLWKDIGLKKH